MATIGFIGLGIMGAPMAANLVTAGHAVRGYTLGAVPDGLGVTPVPSVRAACEGADIVVTMLPDTPDVLAVALGDDEALGSTVLQRKRDNVLRGDFTPGFRIALHDKDLGIINEAARDKGVVLPATALITQLVRSLKVRGDGGLDHSALYKLTAELNEMSL
ncbi:NAD-binding protein [Cellulomonas hominis]